MKQALVVNQALRDRARDLALLKLNKDRSYTKSIDNSTKIKFLKLVKSFERELTYESIIHFKPRQKQIDFFNLKSRFRANIGANRSGKTFTTTREDTYHLTGEYPEWWEGERWPGPVDLYATGASWGQVAKVLQKELLGTANAKTKKGFGTGSIPKRCIIMGSIVKDGVNVMSVNIRHKSGGESKVTFLNYNQDPDDLQGFKAELLLFDEQPPVKIWDELVQRTHQTRYNRPGTVKCSFTPLKGRTGLVTKFENREEGFDMTRTTWDDIPEYDDMFRGTIFEKDYPFFTEADRKIAFGAISDPAEIEPRVWGIPKSVGGGVFNTEYLDEAIIDTTNVEKHPSWDRGRSIDLGLSRDPSVISYGCWDKMRDIIYILGQNAFRGSLVDDYMYELLKAPLNKYPLVVPSDGNTKGRYVRGGNQSAISLMKKEGVKLTPEVFKNPPDHTGKQNTIRKVGIDEINFRLRNGTLKIDKSCQDLISELYSAEWSDTSPDKQKEAPDDHTDSARYLIMTLVQNLGSSAEDSTRVVRQSYNSRRAMYNLRRKPRR